MVGNAKSHDDSRGTDQPRTDSFEKVSPRDLVPYYNDPQKMSWGVFDIETTGRTWDSEVNMIGVHRVGGYEMGRFTESRTWLFTRTDTPSGDHNLDPEALDETTGLNVEVIAADSEEELLRETREAVLSEIVEEDTIMTAYNGETFKGGFDMGFLRQRAEQYRLPHPFKSTRFVDVYEAISYKDRLNTTDTCILGNPEQGTIRKGQIRKFAEEYANLDLPDDKPHMDTKGGIKDQLYKEGYGEDELALFAENELDGHRPLRPKNDLDSVFEQVTANQDLDTDPTDYDPWEDSGKVLDAWDEGDIQAIALHNLADVVQTARVMEFSVRQLPPKHLSPNWL